VLKENMSSKQKEIIRFMIMMIFVGFALFIASYHDIVRSYNSTLLALTYEYGFISRALLGSIFHFFDMILPIDMIDYSMTLLFAQVTTALFFIFLYWFIYLCLKKCKEEYLKPCEYLIMFMMIFTITTHSAGYNFFRVDIMMIAVSVLGALLIVYEKAEWLVIALSAIGVLFHQGYVFMYFNIILILLFFKLLDAKDNKRRWKYGVLFVLSFGIGSVLFLYFEFFSRTNGAAIYDQVLAEAKLLAHNGAYHTGLLEHEVLGLNLDDSEARFRAFNKDEFKVALVLFMPYMAIATKFFVDLIKAAKTKFDKFKYVVVLIYSFTMLPDFLLKVDYGRWFMAVMIYYIVVILALMMMRDEHIEKHIGNTFEWISKKPWAFLLIIYPVLLVPLCDIDINPIINYITTEMINMGIF